MHAKLMALVLLLASFIVADSAMAQSSPAVMESRIEALERQLRLLQRRVSGGAAVAEEPAAADPAAPGDRQLLADLLARLGTLDRQMRQLNGRLEEFEYRQNELAETVEALRTQMALVREQQLTGAPAAATAGVAAATAQPVAPTGDVLPETELETPTVPEVALPEGTTAEKFDFAFSYVRRNDLDGGRQAMELFLDAHGSDPEAANAKFWLGRIHMQQNRNAEAAQQFLDLIESHPNHDKRVDALVDLADVLVALGAADDACNALAEFRRIEDRASDRLRTRARRTAETARCDIF